MNKQFPYTSLVVVIPVIYMITAMFSLPAVLADEATTTLIYMDIESATSTLFQGRLSVSACAADASSTPTVSGYCAIRQSGLDSTWSAFGGNQFLESVGGAGNEYALNHYWNWFSNLEYGNTSLDQHLLSADERLLVTLGRFPLALKISTTTPEIGATTTVTILEFGFDDAWNAVWLPAASSSIAIGGEIISAEADGTYAFSPTSTDPVYMRGIKAGFLDSEILSLQPFFMYAEISTTTAPTSTASSMSPVEPEPSPQIQSGGGGYTHRAPDLVHALQFLSDHQELDGSFGAALYTDWAALAILYGPSSPAREKIIAYLKSGPDVFGSITEYERHAMALEAAGLSPYDGTGMNYIQKILEGFDGTQIGNPDLVNDDIFAVFPLMKAGYVPEDTIIKKTTEFIISKQEGNGSWVNSVDVTAAALQALVLVRPLATVDESISRARAFLVLHQQPDGGFGSTFSTSWALQAIIALHEPPSDWIVQGKTPEDYLYAQQQSDGGFEPATSDMATRIWSTAYVIPAAVHRSWYSLLSSFSKQTIQEPHESNNPNVSPYTDAGSGTTTLTASTSIPRREAPIALSVKTDPVQKGLAKAFISAAEVKPEENSPTEETTVIQTNTEPVQVAAAGEVAPPRRPIPLLPIAGVSLLAITALFILIKYTHA